MLKRLVPYAIKLRIKLLLRWLNDRKVNFSKQEASEESYSFSLSTKQVIRKSYLYENKVHNLKLGSKKVEEYIIYPNEVFSLWRSLGKPSKKRGYKKGRNIIKGKLSEDVGGGLCQLSGIMYHTALLAGLEIVERYNHTVDIYKEEERLSPLGTDATIVYGYKDLRIKNKQDFPVRFRFKINSEEIECSILSQKPLKQKSLDVSREEHQDFRSVTIAVDGKQVSQSKYLLPT